MTAGGHRTSRDAAAALTRRLRPDGSARETVDDAIDDLRNRADAELAAESRAARVWQQRVDEESATWLGTLLDLAEAGDLVLLDTDRGTTLTGSIEAVGRDVIVLRNAPRERVICVADTLTSVRALHRSATAQGSRPTADVDLRMLLHAAADERQDVVVQPRGAMSPTIAGTMLSCGDDICSLRAHVASSARTERNPAVHVRLGAIASVTLRDDY